MGPPQVMQGPLQPHARHPQPHTRPSLLHVGHPSPVPDSKPEWDALSPTQDPPNSMQDPSAPRETFPAPCETLPVPRKTLIPLLTFEARDLTGVGLLGLVLGCALGALGARQLLLDAAARVGLFPSEGADASREPFALHFLLQLRHFVSHLTGQLALRAALLAPHLLLRGEVNGDAQDGGQPLTPQSPAPRQGALTAAPAMAPYCCSSLLRFFLGWGSARSSAHSRDRLLCTALRERAVGTHRPPSTRTPPLFFPPATFTLLNVS